MTPSQKDTEFKQMIQALHDRGISVVMDVVYNHTYSTDSCFNRTVPGYYYRMHSSSAYLTQFRYRSLNRLNMLMMNAFCSSNPEQFC